MLVLKANKLSKKHMKSPTIIGAILILSLGLFSCSKDESAGPIVSETRNLPAYDEIEIAGAFEVEIDESFDFDVEITAPDNKMSFIETVVVGDKLIVRERDNDIKDTRIIIKLSNQDLDYVELSGSGLIESDTLRSSNLSIELNGSGSMDLIVDADEVDTEISGSGSIEIYGFANEVVNEISGSGLINSRSVESQHGSASIDGSGLIMIYASDSFFGRVNGSGTIQYWGDPESTDTDVDGSGQIIDMQ